MERAPWIIGGSIVLAAVIMAVALFAVNKDEEPAQREAPGVDETILIGAEQRAQDRAAQSNLRNALAAAKTYFTDSETYSGWTPEIASQIEPFLIWRGDDPARAKVVSINLASEGALVMSTKSASGQAFCIADNAFGIAAGTLYGHGDASGALDAAACSGGW